MIHASPAKVFVSRVVPNVAYEILAQAGFEIRRWEKNFPPNRTDLLAACSQVDGLLCCLTETIDDELLMACPQLRVIANMAVGYNNIDIGAALRRGLRIGNTPGVLTQSTADTAILLMLMAARRVKEAQASVVEGKWGTWDPVGLLGRDLSGGTLGVIGMGRIGSAVAQHCRWAWRMKIVYTSKSPKREMEVSLGAERLPLDELLRQSDVVTIHTQLNATTRKMCNAHFFASMRPDSIFINTARGEILDQEALCQALQSGHLFAAGLDVTDPEPISSNHPLVREPRCVILPHIGSATELTRQRMAEMAARNLVAGLKGEAMPSEVLLKSS